MSSYGCKVFDRWRHSPDIQAAVGRSGALADDYAVTVVKYETQVTDLQSQPKQDTPAAAPDDITNEYPAGYDEMQESEKRASLAKNLLPPMYSDATRSPLRAQVRAGTNDNVFEFTLKR